MMNDEGFVSSRLRALLFGIVSAASGLALTGCDRPAPTCEAYDAAGYWREADGERLTPVAVLTLDTLRSVPEVTAILRAGAAARCENMYLDLVAGSQGEYADEQEPADDLASSCAAASRAVQRFHAAHPGVLDDVVITPAPACAVSFAGYLRDVAYCSQDADLIAADLSCSETPRYCSDANETCLECPGELSYAGLSDECHSVLATRAALDMRCSEDVVDTGPDESDPHVNFLVHAVQAALEELPALIAKHEVVLDGLDTLQASIPESLDERRVRACQEPALGTVSESITELNVGADILRELLTSTRNL